MSNQPKPPTGEWTAAKVSEIYNDSGINGLTKAINAALAAERERIALHLAGVSSAALIESNELVQQLHEQLSTAVEALKVIEIGHGVDARTARAALAKAGKQ